MKRRRLISVLIAVVSLVTAISVVAGPVLACSMGLTPGFWKNHTSLWTSWNTGTNYYDTIFGVPSTFTGKDGSSVNLHIRLLDALNANGNKSGIEAFLRQSAAAWLNSSLLTDYFEELDVKAIVQTAFGVVSDADYGAYVGWRTPHLAKGDIEGIKNFLEANNSLENAVFK